MNHAGFGGFIERGGQIAQGFGGFFLFAGAEQFCIGLLQSAKAGLDTTVSKLFPGAMRMRRSADFVFGIKINQILKSEAETVTISFFLSTACFCDTACFACFCVVATRV